MGLLAFIVVGLIAGWLAGKLMRGGGYGVLVDIILGVSGGMLGHELPVGHDHGYVWRLDNYWHLEQKDGGVYVQEESIALSRSVPIVLPWLVSPLLESIPRDVLTHLLTATRDATLKTI